MPSGQRPRRIRPWQPRPPQRAWHAPPPPRPARTRLSADHPGRQPRSAHQARKAQRVPASSRPRRQPRTRSARAFPDRALAWAQHRAFRLGEPCRRVLSTHLQPNRRKAACRVLSTRRHHPRCRAACRQANRLVERPSRALSAEDSPRRRPVHNRLPLLTGLEPGGRSSSRGRVCSI